VGYSAGDHEYDAPDRDQTVVYIADAGEVSLALVAAAHALAGHARTQALAGRIRDALRRFRAFCEMFRLRSGGMGLGYTRRDFYSRETKRMLPYMQAHLQPWLFSTAVAGVNTYAGLFSLEADPDDWEKAMQSLDYLLDHVPNHSERKERGTASNSSDDITVLHRVMDWVFDCCAAPGDDAGGEDPTPEPRFAAPERQRLYVLWKHVMHRVADTQSELGEWPVHAADRYVARYGTPLRHRLLYGYALTTYLGCLGVREGEDERLLEARERQLWLAGDADLRREHYGVCQPGVHMMPTGLWAMTMAELVQPGITLVGGMRGSR